MGIVLPLRDAKASALLFSFDGIGSLSLFILGSFDGQHWFSVAIPFNLPWLCVCVRAFAMCLAGAQWPGPRLLLHRPVAVIAHQSDQIDWSERTRSQFQLWDPHKFNDWMKRIDSWLQSLIERSDILFANYFYAFTNVVFICSQLSIDTLPLPPSSVLSGTSGSERLEHVIRVRMGRTEVDTRPMAQVIHAFVGELIANAEVIFARRIYRTFRRIFN